MKNKDMIDTDVSEVKKTWTSTQQVIAFALVGAFILVIFGWMFFPPKSVDQAALSIINMLIGALVAKMTTVVDFFLGSSEGSKMKDEAQNRTIERLTGTGSGTAIMAAAREVAPAAAKEAAPPAADVAAPPAAEIAVEHALAERESNKEGKSP
jgi:ammonia channel protein AmtB